MCTGVLVQIRTHGTLTRSAVFKTAALNHSATHPSPPVWPRSQIAHPDFSCHQPLRSFVRPDLPHDARNGGGSCSGGIGMGGGGSSIGTGSDGSKGGNGGTGGGAGGTRAR